MTSGISEWILDDLIWIPYGIALNLYMESTIKHDKLGHRIWMDLASGNREPHMTMKNPFNFMSERRFSWDNYICIKQELS